jgi:GntR family transcriptional regulator
VPLYRQIAAIIKHRILSGQYPPNTRIPTESEPVETYEVARSTARRAIAALRDEGLVYTVPARGTYVTEQSNSTKQARNLGILLINASQPSLPLCHCRF